MCHWLYSTGKILIKGVMGREETLMRHLMRLMSETSSIIKTLNLNVTISECCRCHPGELDKPEAGVPRCQSGSRRWLIVVSWCLSWCGYLQGQTGGILHRIFPNTRGMYLLDLLWILAAITQNKESLWALWVRPGANLKTQSEYGGGGLTIRANDYFFSLPITSSSSSNKLR